MIVEFIGSTGAGKSTLISETKQRLSNSDRVLTSYDLVARRVGMQTVTHPTVKNIIQEVIGFPYFLHSMYRHKDFALFTLKILAQQSNLTIFTVNNLRSFERKMGVFEINKRIKQNKIILVDEGTVLLAHNIFVFNDIQFSREDILNFASLVPLPDIIIYVKAPIEHLISRTLQRGDPPREIKFKTRDSIGNYIRRAVLMFEELILHERIRVRTLVVENPDSGEVSAIVDNICEYILQSANSDNKN